MLFSKKLKLHDPGVTAAWAVMQLFPNFNCRNFCTSNGKMWSQNMMLRV